MKKKKSKMTADILKDNKKPSVRRCTAHHASSDGRTVMPSLAWTLVPPATERDQSDAATGASWAGLTTGRRRRLPAQTKAADSETLKPGLGRGWSQATDDIDIALHGTGTGLIEIEIMSAEAAAGTWDIPNPGLFYLFIYFFSAHQASSCTYLVCTLSRSLSDLSRAMGTGFGAAEHDKRHSHDHDHGGRPWVSWLPWIAHPSDLELCDFDEVRQV